LTKNNSVLLAPSPLPPVLWSLAISLLIAGYIVIIAVPDVEDAEALEKRLSPLEQKSALRVLIYDPNDVSCASHASEPKLTVYSPRHSRHSKGLYTLL
jgi:hypothetical protein